MLRRAIPIGRLFGIRLDVHPSWFFVYALVTITLANATPAAIGTGRVASYALAAIAGVALFASVVAHELAHALCARRFGVETRSISLFLFGGVATLEAEPPTPLADVLVAVAGPAMSALLAGLAYAAMHLVDRVVPIAAVDSVVSILAYIAVANGVLAAFNLIPAYPMDGGRVLRAIVWRLRGDRDGATVTAALVGLGFAAVFTVGALAAMAATRSLQFGWYLVLAGFLGRQCWTQVRALRRTSARALGGLVEAA